jgi:hypothetical protein
VRRVPDLALDRREEQHAAERQGRDQPEVVAHRAARQPGAGEPAQDQQRERQDQRRDQEGRDDVVAGASAERRTGQHQERRERRERHVRGLAGRLLDPRRRELAAAQRAKPRPRHQPAALDLGSVVEHDGLDLRPVVAGQRRVDRGAAVQPRVGLIDEVRRRRWMPDPIPRDDAVAGEAYREQRCVQPHRGTLERRQGTW